MAIPQQGRSKLELHPSLLLHNNSAKSLLVLQILLVAFSNGLSKYLDIYESQRRGKSALSLLLIMGEK